MKRKMNVIFTFFALQIAILYYLSTNIITLTDKLLIQIYSICTGCQIKTGTRLF